MTQQRFGRWHGARGAPLAGILFFATMVLASTTAAWAQTGTGEYSIHFGEDLGLSDGLVLEENSAVASVRFTSETGRTPAEGTRLHLFIEHAAGLDDGRSFLSVTLNHGLLRSLRLGERDGDRREVVIPVPPEMLQRENEIVLSVHQHALDDGPAWTAIGGESFIRVDYEEEDAPLALRDLPAPLVDVYSYRPQAISVLLPPEPRIETLEATALVVARFANRAAPEPLAVNVVPTMDAARDPLLVVGTPDEQPGLARLEEALPLAVRGMDDRTVLASESGEVARPEEGFLGLTRHPGGAAVPALVVTGNDAQGVHSAAMAVVAGEVDGNRPSARISEEVRLPSRRARDWEGFIPPKSRFTLGDMGMDAVWVGPDRAGSRTLTIQATPDARFLPFGHSMNLSFSLASRHAPGEAAIALRLNGEAIGDFDVAEASSGRRASIRTRIPPDLLGTENELEVVWRGTNERQGDGTGAWLLPDSELYLPRSYRAEVPDLAMLQFGMFPLGLKSDLSETIVLAPAASSQAGFQALLQLAAELGRVMPSDHLRFRVRREEELGGGERSSSDFIALETDEGLSAGAAAVEMSESPWNARRFMMRIASGSPDELPGAVRSVFSEMEQLGGDRAVIRNGVVTYERTHPTRRMGERAVLTYLEAWLTQNWLALPLILGVASALLFAAWRATLARYRGEEESRRNDPRSPA